MDANSLNGCSSSAHSSDTIVIKKEKIEIDETALNELLVDPFVYFGSPTQNSNIRDSIESNQATSSGFHRANQLNENRKRFSLDSNNHFLASSNCSFMNEIIKEQNGEHHLNGNEYPAQEQTNLNEDEKLGHSISEEEEAEDVEQSEEEEEEDEKKEAEREEHAQKKMDEKAPFSQNTHSTTKPAHIITNDFYNLKCHNSTNININNNNYNNNFLLEKIVNLFTHKKSPYVRKHIRQVDQSKPSLLSSKNVAIIALLFSVIVYFFTSSSSSSSSSTRPSETVNTTPNINENVDNMIRQRESFEAKLNKHLKQKYPNQTKTFWANIESTFKHSVLNAKDPSIVMLVNDRQTKDLSSALANDILKFYLSILDKREDSLSGLRIDAKNDHDLMSIIQENDFNQVKYLIDKKLMSIFGAGGKLALINNIQHIPATSMILFYTYGDILPDAKYPGVLILMTLDLEDISLSDQQRASMLKSTAKLSLFVESHLKRLWSNLVHEDQLAPLFSRIGNNVILVNTE